jgi:long-chain acyl-CoA synthetase
MAADTVPARLFAQERHRPDAPAWCEKVDGAWRATRWADHARLVRRAARALAALGVEKGSAVAILGFNRPEWVVMDLAAMCLGAVPVGIYTTSSPDEVQYIAAHCDAAVILVESVAQWEKVNARRGDLPELASSAYECVVASQTVQCSSATPFGARCVAPGAPRPPARPPARRRTQ